MTRASIARWNLPRAVACLALLAACGACDAARGAGPGPAIGAEIARLLEASSRIDRAGLPEGFAERLGQHAATLEGLRQEESQELRLYQLAETFVGVETLAFYAGNRQAGESLEMLRALGETLRGDFEITTPAVDGSVRGALIQTAATRADRLYRASLQYGQISTPDSGLFYLAVAEANRRLLDFLSSFDDTNGDAVPDRGRLLAVAADIEAATLRQLDRDPTSREMIPVSVRLDEAREMLEARREVGAALQLLEAQRELSLRSETDQGSDDSGSQHDPGHGGAGSLRALLAALGESRQDQPDEQRARIARGVLAPLYESMLVGPGGPDDDAMRSVTLTLVRWPYT